MFLKKFKFGNKYIGDNCNIFFIAEIGINHEGSFNNCMKLIDEAANAGADAIKLQTIDPDENYLKNTSSYKIFKRSFFDKSKTIKLFQYAKSKQINFFTTIGDLKTLDWFSKLNPPGYKISSGLFTHFPLLHKIIKYNKPILLSTGLANEKEVEQVYGILKKNKAKKVAFLHCCSIYPSPEEMINLLTIKFYKEKYCIPIGYSDHSMDYMNILYAISGGASIIEKHFTLDKKKRNFDHHISCEPRELSQIIKKIRNLEIVLGKSKKIISLKEKSKRKLMRRFIVAERNLKPEKELSINDLAFKRIKNSRFAIDAKFTNKVIGKKIKKKFIKDEILLKKHLK